MYEYKQLQFYQMPENICEKNKYRNVEREMFPENI